MTKKEIKVYAYAGPDSSTHCHATCDFLRKDRCELFGGIKLAVTRTTKGEKYYYRCKACKEIGV